MTYRYLTIEVLYIVSANLTSVLKRKSQYNSTSEKAQVFHLFFSIFVYESQRYSCQKNPILMYKNNNKTEGCGSHCYEDLGEGVNHKYD